MYVYKSAKFIEKKLNPEIKEGDISSYKMMDIYSMFLKAYVLVYDDFTKKDIWLNLDCIKDKYILSEIKLKEVLSIERTIDETDYLPSKIKQAKYSDVYMSAYKVDLCSIERELDSSYPRDMLPDLVIYRPPYNTDLSLLHTHCLVTLNGYCQPTDASRVKNEAYVKGGAFVSYFANANQMGILSFADIGEITKEFIDDEKIQTSEDSNTAFYIKTDTDLTDKTVMLSLGGYLIIPDNYTISTINSNLISLKLDNIQLLEKYLESRKYIDLSSLQLDESINNKDMINTEEFFSKETIISWLKMPQSFLVIVDAKELLFTRIYLRPGKLPGKYITYHKPFLPLIVGYGRMAEYWATKDDGQYCINTTITGYSNYTFKYTSDKYKKNIDDSRLPGDTYDMEHPYFLQILSIS